MIHTSRAVIVEGKYDRIKLENIVDGLVLTTGGFNVYKDRELQALLRRLGKETGLLLLTDSDDAGFRIRNFVADIAGRENVVHAYLPEFQGKERRKAHPGKAGLLGVEGAPAEAVERALRDALRSQPREESEARQRRQIVAADLFEDGLSGSAGARERRARFLRAANLPSRLSTNALLALLNRLVGYEKYKEMAAALRQAETARRPEEEKTTDMSL